MIKIGGTEIADVLIGNTQIYSVWLGGTKMWEKGSTPVSPYDAEVEYLTGTGTQYINTGITCSNKYKVEIKFTADGSVVGAVFGSRNYVSNLSKAFHIYSLSNGQVQFGYGTRSNNVTVTQSTPHVYVLDKNNYYIDGTLKGTFTSATFTCSTTALLFTAYTGSGGTTVESRMLNGNIYYCKIWNDGTLVRDYIPVRKDGVGYMYDRVSKTLFGNAGTGSFTLGPDVT